MAAARATHHRHDVLFRDLVIDVNPAMVKEALAMMGKIGPGFRLPLCETTPEKRGQMRKTLAELGLVQA
jgi:4-hydroxy-tetrahydrodipicolinate synthase